MVERRNQPPEWFETGSEKRESSSPETFQESRVTEAVQTEEGRRSSDTTTVHDSVDDLSVTEPEKSQKAEVNIFQLLKQPRVLAAALIAFAHGVAFNVFEVSQQVKIYNKHINLQIERILTDEFAVFF